MMFDYDGGNVGERQIGHERRRSQNMNIDPRSKLNKIILVYVYRDGHNLDK